jgi:arylsulfatase A-like enzyme
MIFVTQHILLLSSLLAGGQPQKPNLVLILADQWRGTALGSLCNEPVITPNLDKLASEGINFANAVSSYPVSSPARGMLMTGMYPTHTGVTNNCNSESAPYHVELLQSARCWSDVLRDKGYATAYIGKWHLDAPYKPYIDTYNNRGKVAWNEWCSPQRRHGFEHWISYGTYDNHLHPMYWNTHSTREQFYYVNQWGPAYETDCAISYLDSIKNTNQPFAMVVSMNPPHTGYELVPERYKEMYKNLDVEALCKDRPDIPEKGTTEGDYFRNNVRNYYACMTGVDENVGRIIDQLRKNGQLENTIIVFASDHGDCMGAHHVIGKDIYYEEAMRVPMIISWKGQLRARRDNHTMIAFADLYPTLLSLMGYKKDIPSSVQSHDLSSELLRSKENSKLSQPYYYIALGDSTTGYRGWRTQRYTLAIHCTKGIIDKKILFDRVKDSREMRNIANDNPTVVKQLTLELKDWLIKTNDNFANYLK